MRDLVPAKARKAEICSEHKNKISIIKIINRILFAMYNYC
jgi:hypothetical protein